MQQEVVKELLFISQHPGAIDPEPTQTSATTEARVPVIRVNLVQSVHLQVVEVSLDSQEDLQQPLLLDGAQLTCGVGAHTSLIDVDKDGRALTVLSNPTGCSMTVDEGSPLGVAVPVEPVEPEPRVLQPTESKSESGPSSTTELTTLAAESASVSRVHTKPDTWRKKRLAESIG